MLKGCFHSNGDQISNKPNIKLVLDLEVSRSRANPLRIILEYYNGHLPYSTLEHQQVRLIGMGSYFNTRI